MTASQSNLSVPCVGESTSGITLPTRTEAEARAATGNRSAADYAIEHAEYLAKAAEHFLDTHDSDPDAYIDGARELRNRIYEFRKRALRAIAERTVRRGIPTQGET